MASISAHVTMLRKSYFRLGKVRKLQEEEEEEELNAFAKLDKRLSGYEELKPEEFLHILTFCENLILDHSKLKKNQKD
jgi:hypothetical protein